MQYQVTAMPGWRFDINGFLVTAFAGLDYQVFRTYPIDPGTNLRGQHMGFRAAIELWHEPSATTMLAADASMSSIGAGNYARLAYGWRMIDQFYLGPEVQAYVTGNYRHARVGVHLTASKRYEHEWSAAMGFAEDNERRSGFYVRIGYLTRR